MHETQPGQPFAPLRTSLIRAALALAVIACGLSLRWYGFPLGLPAFIVKYGGSLLWATMVFLLAGVVLPRLTRSQLAAVAVVIAAVAEFSRLEHTPWLDAFRLTTAGALLLGRIFSPWNLLAYAVGIAFGMWIDHLAATHALGQSEACPPQADGGHGANAPSHPTRPMPSLTPPAETARTARAPPRSGA